MSDELQTLKYALAQGASGSDVKRVQEWLCLHGFNVVVDGDFGPATRDAVRRYQSVSGLLATGMADGTTFEAMKTPMRKAMELPPAGPRSLGGFVVTVARQHLAARPREVGGPNSGPWVRLYMDGHEGVDWPWCAGFATFCLRQAALAMGVPAPLSRNFSCDMLVKAARDKKSFFSAGTGTAKKLDLAGSFFVHRARPGDWDHIGIITAVSGDVFHTIEGNTNDAGHREGYEVCSRTRGFSPAMDFIVLPQ